jgi:hypothetical protein
MQLFGGSVSTFLFAFDIKKNNIDNFKIFSFKFTKKN